MLIVVHKLIQDLVDVQRTAPRYQVDADTAQVIRAPAPPYKHLLPSDRNALDDLDDEVLFVCSEAVNEMFCLLEDFFVHEVTAYPPKNSSASTSAPLSIPIGLEDPVDIDEDGCAIQLEESLKDVHGSDHPFE